MARGSAPARSWCKRKEFKGPWRHRDGGRAAPGRATTRIGRARLSRAGCAAVDPRIQRHRAAHSGHEHMRPASVASPERGPRRGAMIAVQLYTIRTQLQDPSRLSGVLGRLREIGYRAVEVAGLGAKTVSRFGEELRRADLVACAAHVPLNRLMDDLDGAVDEGRDWGCEYVVVPSLPEAYRSGDGYQRFAAEAAQLAATPGPDGSSWSRTNRGATRWRAWRSALPTWRNSPPVSDWRHDDAQAPAWSNRRPRVRVRAGDDDLRAGSR